MAEDYLLAINPTPEIWTATINDVKVPLRVWTGRTRGGAMVDVYVLSIVPEAEAGTDAYARFRAELPEFMKPARDTFKVGME